MSAKLHPLVRTPMKIHSLVFNNRLHLLDQVELQLWLLKMVRFNLLTHLQLRTLELCNHRIVLLHLKVVSKTKTEARSTQISKTKHPKLENEAPKSRKRSTQNSKTKHLSKTKHPKLETTVGWTTTILRLAWRNPNQAEAADAFAPPTSTKSIPRLYKSLPTI